MSEEREEFYLLYFCLLVLGTLKSQYDTTHYIPYLADLTGATKMANLEYQSVFNGAYFMFSTFEAGSTNVKVYKRKNFVFFNPEYKIRHQAEYSIIVATEEGDAYPDTKKAILQYIKKFNPTHSKLKLKVKNQ